MQAVAVGALPDGTPVIVSGGGDGTVRVWRLADGTPVGEPLRGHDGGVHAVAVGALPDGTPVIVSGGRDGMVRVWRLADGTPLVPPLDLPESVSGIAVHGNVIVTAAGADIAVHQPGSRGRCDSCCSISGTTTGENNRIMAGYPVHQPCATRAERRYPLAAAEPLPPVIQYIPLTLRRRHGKTGTSTTTVTAIRGGGVTLAEAADAFLSSLRVVNPNTPSCPRRGDRPPGRRARPAPAARRGAWRRGAAALRL